MAEAATNGNRCWLSCATSFVDYNQARVNLLIANWERVQQLVTPAVDWLRINYLICCAQAPGEDKQCDGGGGDDEDDDDGGSNSSSSSDDEGD